MRSLVAKRLLDVILSCCALVVCAPVMIAIAVLIRVTMGRGVLFRQIRPGVGGQPFTLYKFRSMVDLYDANGNKLADDQRVTKLGKVLRSTSLDELPEIWNVIKGDMSLVGPRPLLMDYLDLYTQEQFRRHEVKPGITGWAQVNGRNTVDWEDRFRMDVWYVDNWNVLLDLKILWLTLIKVIKQEGISAEDHVTMPKFRGSASRSQL